MTDVNPPGQAFDATLSLTKGKILLRDSITFLALCSVTVAMFGVTLFLFRSFEERREDLGRRWSERGQLALQHGQPDYAVQALRTALSYNATDRAAQLSLAQALAVSGRTEEAENYFLNLWEARPGDGFVNLQLARLTRKRGDTTAAVNYYRSAIFGSWNGDGSTRRREVRLELADYFASRGDDAAARTELLVAAGNAPQSEYLEVSLGDRLEAIGDRKDALQLYEKAVQVDPGRSSALEKAGRTAYELGDYATASTLLSRALQQTSHDQPAPAEEAALQALAANARRVQDLTLSRSLPAQERATHLVTAATSAEKRLETCRTQARPDTAASAVLAGVQQRWKAERARAVWTLARDAVAADSAETLINDTETVTARVCGAPTGDDALLLMLAGAPGGAR